MEELLETAEAGEEIKLLETALDNLAFTEDMRPFTLFDFAENNFETELSELLLEEEDYPGFDIEDDDEEMQD